MPDGSTFIRENATASSSHGQLLYRDPFALGIVSQAERAALRRHRRAIKGQTTGAAEFPALRARTILHAWPGTPDSMPVFPGSVRYWHLIAFFEGEWVEKRRGSKLLPHERAAAVVCRRGMALHDSKRQFLEISRFMLNLAAKNRDTRSVERIRGRGRKERRALLRDAWRKSRPALRSFFAAVKHYVDLRERYDAAYMPLRDLLQAHMADWQAYSVANEAADLERFRVRNLHPTAPCKIMGRFHEADGTSHTRVMHKYEIERLRTTPFAAAREKEDSDRRLAALREWQKSCDAVDNSNRDPYIMAAEWIAKERYEETRRRLAGAPTRSVEDIRCKLEYLAFLEFERENDCESDRLVYRLIDDIKAGKVAQRA